MNALYPYIDLHCDTLLRAWLQGKPTLVELTDTMTDLKKLRAGGCLAQCFAIFLRSIDYIAKANDYPGDEIYISDLHRIFVQTEKEHGAFFARVESAEDLEALRASGKVGGILTMEDGRAVQGRMENIKRFYDMGVRILALLWNHANCFGAPNSRDPAVMNTGLTDFGKEAVPYMEYLGMGIDVSHLSDGGFWDVAQLAKKPFFATHSNCRALNPHPRSMTDEMIRALADKGGVMGINFCPEFLTKDITRTDAKIDGIAAQLRHRINVGGLECAAVGTDFDGIEGELEIPDASHMPRLFEELAKRGFTADELEHIAYRNTERVLKEIL
ncbi:MAG: dipeptidase [Lachnospiraceae bacterium]|nr:dipeptidase [Lachnospiraceae bacterium]